MIDSGVFVLNLRNEVMPVGILEVSSFSLLCFVTRGTQGERVVKKDAGWIAVNLLESVAEVLESNGINDRNLFIQKVQNAYNSVKLDFSWGDNIAPKS